jgi:hypothetical protein
MQKELEVVSVCSGLDHQLVCGLSPRGIFVVEIKGIFSVRVIRTRSSVFNIGIRKLG